MIAAAGCGRIAFDPQTDGGAPLTISPVPLLAGGSIRHVAHAGAARYALGEVGHAFRSDASASTSWSPCAYKLGQDIEGADDGRVMIAAADDAYLSMDNCASWQPLGLGQQAYRLRFDGPRVWATTPTGLYRFENNRWTSVPTPFGTVQTTGLCIDPTGQTIAVGSYTGVIVSTDGGNNWALRNSGLYTAKIFDLDMLPSNPLEMYAAESGITAVNPGLTTTIDGGVSWVNRYQSASLYSVNVDPTQPNRAVASLLFTTWFTSIDRFVSYTTSTFSPDNEPSQPMGMDFAPDGTLFIGSDRGVYVAAPGTFTPIAKHDGLNAWRARKIATSGNDTYLATGAGVLASRDGAPFTLSVAGMTTNLKLYSVAVSPVDPKVLIAVGNRVVHISLDRGQTWLTQAQGVIIRDVHFVGARVYIAIDGASGSEILYADPPYASWVKLAVIGPTITDLLDRDGMIHAATEGGVIRTSDGVQLETADLGGARVTSLALVGDGRLIAGTDAGAWMSDTSGWNWQQIVSGRAVTSVAAAGSMLVIGMRGGIQVSTTDGATWSDVIEIVPELRVADFAVSNGLLLIAVDGSGLFSAALP